MAEHAVRVLDLVNPPPLLGEKAESHQCKYLVVLSTHSDIQALSPRREIAVMH